MGDGNISPNRKDGIQTMNIQGFLSNISSDGLARSNRFRVVFAPPFGIDQPLNSDVLRSTSIFVEAAELPGRNLQSSDFRIYGPSYKNPFLSEYSEINFTVLCDKNLTQKRVFDAWLNYINPTDTFDFNYRDQYTADVLIEQLDDKGAPAYSVVLVEAFPTAVAPLTVSWGNDNFHSVQVTMSYRYWEPLSEQKIYNFL